MLVNAEDEKDIIKLCACGRTEKKDFTCDGTHKEDIKIPAQKDVDKGNYYYYCKRGVFYIKYQSRSLKKVKTND